MNRYLRGATVLLCCWPLVVSAAGEAPVASALPATTSSPVSTDVAPATDAVVSSGADVAHRPTLVEKLKEQRPVERSNAGSFGTMTMGLLMTLGILYGLAWMARRLRVRMPGLGSALRVTEMVALGPRERVCVVIDGDKRFLLGVTQHGITILDSSRHEADEDVPDTAFSEKIKKILQNGASHER